MMTKKQKSIGEGFEGYPFHGNWIQIDEWRVKLYGWQSAGALQKWSNYKGMQQAPSACPLGAEAVWKHTLSHADGCLAWNR